MNMKRRIKMRKRLSTIMAIVVALSMLFIAGPVMAAETASQTVTIQVTAIDMITVTSGPTLTFNAANIEVAGTGQTASYVVGVDSFQITDANTTYSVTTNSASEKKITAHIDSALTATGLQLNIELDTSSGVSSGEKDISSALSGSAQNVVTGLIQEADAGETITYRAVATVETPITSYTPEVTLTITDV
jgi:hypothetical protein